MIIYHKVAVLVLCICAMLKKNSVGLQVEERDVLTILQGESALEPEGFTINT